MEQPNTLYYGDNLDILRSSIATGSVELMGGAQPQIPYGQTTFAKAGRVRRASGQQGLDLG